MGQKRDKTQYLSPSSTQTNSVEVQRHIQSITNAIQYVISGTGHSSLPGIDCDATTRDMVGQLRLLLLKALRTKSFVWSTYDSEQAVQYTKLLRFDSDVVRQNAVSNVQTWLQNRPETLQALALLAMDTKNRILELGSIDRTKELQRKENESIETFLDCVEESFIQEFDLKRVDGKDDEVNSMRSVIRSALKKGSVSQKLNMDFANIASLDDHQCSQNIVDLTHIYKTSQLVMTRMAAELQLLLETALEHNLFVDASAEDAQLCVEGLQGPGYLQAMADIYVWFDSNRQSLFDWLLPLAKTLSIRMHEPTLALNSVLYMLHIQQRYDQIHSFRQKVARLYQSMRRKYIHDENLQICLKALNNDNFVQTIFKFVDSSSNMAKLFTDDTQSTLAMGEAIMGGKAFTQFRGVSQSAPVQKMAEKFEQMGMGKITDIIGLMM